MLPALVGHWLLTLLAALLGLAASDGVPAVMYEYEPLSAATV
jgi:hypothetical protein